MIRAAICVTIGLLAAGCGPPSADDTGGPGEPPADDTRPGEPPADPDATGLAGGFQVAPSRAGHLYLEGGELRFLGCGEPGPGQPVEDGVAGRGEALVRELDAGQGDLAAMVRLDGQRLQEIRYAGLEGPGCDRLPPEGQLEARGNEPFWILGVSGEAALLRTPEDQEGVEFGAGTWSRPAGGGWRYEARREEVRSETVTLELEETRCTDSMSGARYPFRATFTRDGVTMEGCALEGREAFAGPGPQGRPPEQEP